MNSSRQKAPELTALPEAKDKFDKFLILDENKVIKDDDKHFLETAPS